MTKIESIKYIIWGSDTPNLTDSQIQSIVDTYSYNDAIKFIAQAEYNQLSQSPSSVNDGANTISFSERLKGLTQIIDLCNKNFYRDPENTTAVQHRKSYTLDLTPQNEWPDYWGRSFKECED